MMERQDANHISEDLEHLAGGVGYHLMGHSEVVKEL